MTTNPPRDDAPDPLKMGGWGPMESDPKSVCNWWLPPQHPLAVICKAETEEAAQAIADALNGRADTPARARESELRRRLTDMVAERDIIDGDEVRDILAALLPTEAEPVAWAEVYDGKVATLALEKTRFATIPLYTTPPAAPTDAALVEPLAWKDGTFYDDDEGPIYSEAVGAGYTYIAEAVDCTLVEAKVKAQAEYEANIRAALASRAAPPEAQETVAEAELHAACHQMIVGFMLDCNAIGLTGAAENLGRTIKEKAAALRALGEGKA